MAKAEKKRRKKEEKRERENHDTQYELNIKLKYKIDTKEVKYAFNMKEAQNHISYLKMSLKNALFALFSGITLCEKK